MELKTPRLTMRTNLQFNNGYIVFPPKNHTIDILGILPTKLEDSSFVFYNDNSDIVCHISIRADRKPCEFIYETQESYQRKGYMQESLAFVLNLFAENNFKENIYALINNNPKSEHILLKSGFSKDTRCELGGDWFVYQPISKFQL